MERNQIKSRRDGYEELFEDSLEYEGVFEKSLEARGGIEPPIKVLQTFALPLGDRATESGGIKTQALCLRFTPSGQIYSLAGDRREPAKARPYFSRINSHFNTSE